ncbi:MAG: hypothetical protein AB4352_08055 [Hormoscilla sp.]
MFPLNGDRSQLGRPIGREGEEIVHNIDGVRLVAVTDCPYPIPTRPEIIATGSSQHSS